MNVVSSAVLVASLIGVATCWAVRSSYERKSVVVGRSAVLIELFTSEGCSSCPPADELLGRLVTEQPTEVAEVIGLEEHVDYWNQLGWKDPYSSGFFSDRQGRYATRLGLPDGPYTPQMIVDGHTQFLGSDEAQAREANRAASSLPKISIDLSYGGSGLAVGISEAAASGEVWLAITEDDLRSNVQRGENSGRVLGHMAVVREMTLIGSVAKEGSFSKLVPIRIRPGWNQTHLKLVVFVQEPGQGRVIGASAISFAAQTSPVPEKDRTRV